MHGVACTSKFDRSALDHGLGGPGRAYVLALSTRLSMAGTINLWKGMMHAR